MVQTDWREILSLSQRELKESDKEGLCESLSWMDADDIELSFADLKTLFRLAQDILKFKSEQVNNLLGQIEKPPRKGRGKSKTSQNADSPKAPSSLAEEIARQEEEIKINKEIIETLYADIAQLEDAKKKIEEDKQDRESESSRSVLSELNAVKELETEVSSKNRHIRKLIADIKSTENENIKLKEKTSILKEKLNEATQLIENLTEKLVNVNRENYQLKEVLGKNEEIKSSLNLEIDALKKELLEKDTEKENVYEDIKAKVQYWKNLARTSKTEIDTLSTENLKLKDAIRLTPKSSPKKNVEETLKIHELQEKLSQATNEIIKSANIIEKLKEDNKNLKKVIDDASEHSAPNTKNESDDGKERVLANKLKKQVKSLVVTNQGLEEMISEREQQLTEITAQLQLLQTNEGIKQLMESLKVKKKQLKSKDQGIKTLVQEINTLTQDVDNLQLENETLRQKLNIPTEKRISVKGTLRKFYDTEKELAKLYKEFKENENKLVELELENLQLDSKVSKLTIFLVNNGFTKDQIEEIYGQYNVNRKVKLEEPAVDPAKHLEQQNELKAVIDENEGLRKGLQELLNFLKDNSTTSSGVLALECPSLETVLRSMEARSVAGWFAPHMSTVMELRAAIGGRDVLLNALHLARKETFDVMQQLSQESTKCTELKEKLHEIESKQSQQDNLIAEDTENVSIGEFGSWMLKPMEDKDVSDSTQIDKYVSKNLLNYEDQLKSNLMYFHNKYKDLFDKMTSMSVQAVDDQNKWSLQEEQYKAEIEKLKSQINGVDEEDISEHSPGIIKLSTSSNLQRKYTYLEDLYKHYRTMNENIKNECMDLKKESLLATANYENEIQKLMFTINRLNDKLKNSVPVEFCKKQNVELNNLTIKYRRSLESSFRYKNNVIDFQKFLDDNKTDILSTFIRTCSNDTEPDSNKVKNILSHVEVSVLQKQIQQLCMELEKREKELKLCETKNLELQAKNAKIIDETLYAETDREVNHIKTELLRLTEENKLLKEQYHFTQNQLTIALTQLRDSEQKQMNNDIETNMLRHQILDLQSTGDNKAIVARLSNEVLVAHLQVTENYNKIERLNLAWNKEKQMRIEAEEMLHTREKVFEVYSSRFETKFKYIHEIMQTFRQQYQGSLPLFSIENYLNNLEEYSRNNQAVENKLNEIEDLRSELMTKHSVYDHILDVSKNKCVEEENDCSHRLQNLVMQNIHAREVDHLNTKLQTMEKSRQEIIKYCNNLEKTLVLVNQAFNRPNNGVLSDKITMFEDKDVAQLDLEDVQSDDEESRKSKTITLPKPQVLKPAKTKSVVKVNSEEVLLGSPIKHQEVLKPDPVDIMTQTSPKKSPTNSKLVQTDEDQQVYALEEKVKNVTKENDKMASDLNEFSKNSKLYEQRLHDTKLEKIELESVIRDLKRTINQKDLAHDNLSASLDILKRQIDDLQDLQLKDKEKTRNNAHKENDSLLTALKQAQLDKENVIAEYKNLLQNEREEYKQSVKEMQSKILELRSNLDRRATESNATSSGLVSSLTNKYSWKVAELEDKCFKLQSELDVSATELKSCQSEMERWKNLASDRLMKMEALNTQLENRHTQEVDSYKAENQHWLVQLNDCQREHLDLRTRLSEQRTAHMKQLQDKDAQIEQLRAVVNGLKTQIMSMQTVIATNDPSFDLSAIVEVEEPSDESQYGSDRLEIKFDSTGDLNEIHDGKLQASSTAIWQEPVIERLRRDKQLASKQNSLLRRQIKAVAARERRARLDAQNLKNQLYRISTSGNRVGTAESAALHGKIASLQAQLAGVRRDTAASVALWDKWKRAQQASDRWQARYEDKCQEVRKLESNLSLSKSAVVRLEKEKRVLLGRCSGLTGNVEDIRPPLTEKQDGEKSEKSLHFDDKLINFGDKSPRLGDKSPLYFDKTPRYVDKSLCEQCASSPVSVKALLERVEAQQRRIAALEVAEKGNEVLVSEYEKSLAEVTSLKGQVLKLESSLLEAQIQTPMQNKDGPQPELDYWKSYCSMLKEENVQLTLRVTSLETQHSGGSSHRVNDLEQTILTLRGLVSKLQSEQKSGIKRGDSRPGSGRSGFEKGRSQLDSYKIEIANLKRSIQDKDILLERSKQMLKIAADREDELLRENMQLRRQLEKITEASPGFLSA